MLRSTLTVGVVLMLASAGFAEGRTAAATESVEKLEGKHLSNIRQVTFGLPRAGEGYFSPDGEWIVYQAYPVGYPFYQIYVQRLDERVPRRVSPGRGRTTCSYFTPDGKSILFASSHTDPQIEATEHKARVKAHKMKRLAAECREAILHPQALKT